MYAELKYFFFGIDFFSFFFSLFSRSLGQWTGSKHSMVFSIACRRMDLRKGLVFVNGRMETSRLRAVSAIRFYKC
jgi:hypothetical protein